MPSVTHWFIKAGIFWFITGMILAFLAELPVLSSATLLPIHYEMAIWGWMIQFVMGTAYWMFPRFLKGAPRGNSHAATLMVILFNTGLYLLLLSVIDLFPDLFAPAGRGLMMISVMLFAGLIWKRVISYRKRGHA